MSKNILVISTGPRKGGNSEILAGEFARGAKDFAGGVTGTGEIKGHDALDKAYEMGKAV